MDNTPKKSTSLAIRQYQAELLESIVNDDPKLEEQLKEYDLSYDEIIIETGTLCRCAVEFECFPLDIQINHDLDMITEWTRRGMCSCGAEKPSQIRDRIASFSFVHLAVGMRNLKLLNFLGDNGCDLNKLTDHMLFSPLYLAVKVKDLQIVKYLLSKNVDVNLKCTPNHSAPLMVALDEGALEIVKLLLSVKNIDVNIRNRRLETALSMTLRIQNEELFTMILDAGADPNVPDSASNTPLLLAVVQGINFVRKLIAKGADVNAKNQRNETPLFYATYTENEEIVEELLKAGARPDDVFHDGTTTLTTAVYQGNLPIVKMLLGYGADMNKCNSQGYTAFHIAAWNGHLDIVKFFLEKGAKHDELTNDKNSPLGLAAHGNCPDVIELLLPLGCRVNNSDKDSDTALHYATYNGMTASVKLLLEYGANPNLRNRLNTTPLWNAVYMKHKDVVKLLLAANVDMEVESPGINQHAQTDHVVHLYQKSVSPFYVAVHRKALDILLLLKASGYNIYTEKWFYRGEYPAGVEDNQNLLAILRQFASTPPRLITVCRNFLRKHFGSKLQDKVCELEIPNNLKNYLILSDCLS